MATEAVVMADQMASQTFKLVRREEVAEGTMAFHFEKPSGFKFKAGQFADVTLIDPPETDAEGNTRTFSIASPPFENEISFHHSAAGHRFQALVEESAAGHGSENRFCRRLLHPTQESCQASRVPRGRNRNHTLTQHRAASPSRPPPAQAVSFLFQSTARRRTFPGHSAERGEDESQLPLDLYHDRNVEVQKGMERRDSSDRPRDAIQAFGNTAGPHLLQCRTARHGCQHEGDACKRGS